MGYISVLLSLHALQGYDIIKLLHSGRNLFMKFLFHTAWEANSRYILPYGLAMLPCSARGIYYLGKQGAVLLGCFRKGN